MTYLSPQCHNALLGIWKLEKYVRRALIKVSTTSHLLTSEETEEFIQKTVMRETKLPRIKSIGRLKALKRFLIELGNKNEKVGALRGSILRDLYPNISDFRDAAKKRRPRPKGYLAPGISKGLSRRLAINRLKGQGASHRRRRGEKPLQFLHGPCLHCGWLIPSYMPRKRHSPCYKQVLKMTGPTSVSEKLTITPVAKRMRGREGEIDIDKAQRNWNCAILRLQGETWEEIAKLAGAKIPSIQDGIALLAEYLPEEPTFVCKLLRAKATQIRELGFALKS